MPFLGGKRRLVDVIAPHFERETLADVFMGGGAVALEGKRMGMRVIANDIAYRSEIIGEALIENGQEKLTEEDVYALFLPTEHDGFIRSNYVPNVFIPEVAEFLDTAFANARKRTGTKRALLMLLLSRYVLSLRQYGSFQVGRKDNEMLMEGKVEELLEISSHSRGKKVLYSMAHPLALLLDLKDKINRGIFPNGQTNEAYRMDCFDFLEMLRNRGESVDTAYFDPPYFGTTVYSDHYRVLDEILAGRLGTEMDDRAFNEKGVLKSFERLFTLAEFIPRWVVSMGYNPAASSGIGGEELLRIVRKFRDADLLPVQHNWTISNIASKRGKKQDENVEYLIVTK
ncbi:MAG: hypothetical protein HGA38_03145 [Candidatus Moranbacteria bacterium]|nr:hypothetical protein [Candidatus Moranbacteria bacterium]